ncbi:putative diacylglycerol O-acyltransferase [Mycobacterium tuberculosis]|nr:putative diacylglycerol O-acyltransferase [Mycobacterium tuberculosis]CMM09417.1 putative diacylglycerol O-acyltransferase [Mycobacterium tuberculosis]CMN03653.1 putative diacylglycerol O-acyltransferase [Mycobacterium tuberculosis]CMN36367.1 putative diacylglycerol O-acyltransferase [Mycobacterium tuberculosis]CMO63454.1 putative diacylglycerol O-acyltransferase [Mycobacterium tuberculosis]
MSQTARRLGPQDMFFLYSESSTTMMHVGALMPFTPPSGAPPDLLRQLVDESKASEVVEPWSLRLSHPELLYHPTQSWVVDDNFDLDYHVRRSALASPGDERELGIPVSRLHSHALDLRRPPWEVHFIEGLEGGRFAIYIKMHHSLIDGYTGQKMLARSLSTDPHDTTHPLFFNIPTPGRSPADTQDSVGGGLIAGAGNVLDGLGDVVRGLGGLVSGVGSVLGSVAGAGRSTFELTKALVNAQLRSDHEYRNLVGSVQAPHCILNTRISRNRRFATQQYPLDRLKAIGAQYDATINDVALAIIGGGLRRFLDELGELPVVLGTWQVSGRLLPRGDAHPRHIRRGRRHHQTRRRTYPRPHRQTPDHRLKRRRGRKQVTRHAVPHLRGGHQRGRTRAGVHPRGVDLRW